MGDSTTYTCNTHGLRNYDCAECAQEERNEIVTKLADDAEVNRILRAERDALTARVKELEALHGGAVRAHVVAIERGEAAEARVKELESDRRLFVAACDSITEYESALKAEQEAHRATKEIVALQLEQIHERADARDAAESERDTARKACDAAQDLNHGLGLAVETARKEASALREALENLVVWARWATKRVSIQMGTPNSGALSAALDLLDSAALSDKEPS